MSLKDEISEILADRDREGLIALIEREVIEPHRQGDLKKAGGRAQYIRKLLRILGADEEFYKLALTSEITREYNKKNIAASNEKARTAGEIPEGYSRASVLRRITRYLANPDEIDTHDSRKVAIRDLVLAGALRPIEVMRINVYERDGTWWATNFAKARNDRPRPFVGLVAPQKFVALLKLAREWIEEEPNLDPASQFARREMKRDGGSFRNLRALAASELVNAHEVSPSERMELARKMLRHDPEQKSAAEFYTKYTKKRIAFKKSRKTGRGIVIN